MPPDSNSINLPLDVVIRSDSGDEISYNEAFKNGNPNYYLENGYNYSFSDDYEDYKENVAYQMTKAIVLCLLIIFLASFITLIVISAL